MCALPVGDLERWAAFSLGLNGPGDRLLNHALIDGDLGAAGVGYVALTNNALIQEISTSAATDYCASVLATGSPERSIAIKTRFSIRRSVMPWLFQKQPVLWHRRAPTN